MRNLFGKCKCPYRVSCPQFPFSPLAALMMGCGTLATYLRYLRDVPSLPCIRRLNPPCFCEGCGREVDGEEGVDDLRKASLRFAAFNLLGDVVRTGSGMVLTATWEIGECSLQGLEVERERVFSSKHLFIVLVPPEHSGPYCRG